MPLHKVTDFLSEISAFFRKNDAHKAMYSILDVIKWLRMNESTLFGMKSKCNNVYPLLQVFQALLLYPCFMVRNPYRFTGSSLSGLLGCKKDVFYRFMVSILRNTHCMPYGLIVILPPHTNQTELQ